MHLGGFIIRIDRDARSPERQICKLTVCFPYRVLHEVTFQGGDARWPIWLRHCPTSWNMVGSIPDQVIGFFISIILPAALWSWGSTQPETEKVPIVSPGR